MVLLGDNLLNVGDIIVVAQSKDEEPQEISLMKLSDATNLIKGEKGTDVYLTVKGLMVVLSKLK